MKITEGRLRQIIKEVIKENFLHEESTDPRIASMHDKYDLSKHKLYNKDDIDLLVKIYMYEHYQFEKLTSMSKLPDRLAKLLVEYNVRVYYSKDLEDSQKLELMIGKINPVTKKELLLPDEENQRDTFELSSDGIQFNLYYPDQNVGLLKTKTKKVTVNLRLESDKALARLAEFLETKNMITLTET